MKKSSLLIVAGLLIAVIALAPSYALANKGGHAAEQHCRIAGGGKGGWGIEGKFFHKAHFLLKNQDELGLSDAQVDTVRKLKLDTKKSIIRQEADIEVLRLDIHALLYDSEVNVKAVNKLIDQKYAIKRDKSKKAVAAFVELKSIISEEQWDNMKALWKSQK